MQPGKTASLLQQPVREQRELDANSNPLASEILAFGDRLFYSIPLSSCLPLARHRHRHRGRESGVGIDFLAGRYRYRFPTPMPMPTGPEMAPHVFGIGGRVIPCYPSTLLPLSPATPFTSESAEPMSFAGPRAHLRVLRRPAMRPVSTMGIPSISRRSNRIASLPGSRAGARPEIGAAATARC